MPYFLKTALKKPSFSNLRTIVKSKTCGIVAFFATRLARADFVDKLLEALGLGLQILGVEFVGDEVVGFIENICLVGFHVARQAP